MSRKSLYIKINRNVRFRNKSIQKWKCINKFTNVLSVKLHVKDEFFILTSLNRMAIDWKRKIITYINEFFYFVSILSLAINVKVDGMKIEQVSLGSRMLLNKSSNSGLYWSVLRFTNFTPTARGITFIFCR